MVSTTGSYRVRAREYPARNGLEWQESDNPASCCDAGEEQAFFSWPSRWRNRGWHPGSRGRSYTMPPAGFWDENERCAGSLHSTSASASASVNFVDSSLCYRFSLTMLSVTTSFRVCDKCGHNHQGKRIRCNPCAAKYAKEYRALHPERARKTVVSWQQRFPDRLKASLRRSKIKAAYGITLEEYDRKLWKQQKKCAICETKEPGGPGNRFMVDHDHDTGKNRGLLCCRCNFLIGQSGDSIRILENAIFYLEDHGLVC